MLFQGCFQYTITVALGTRFWFCHVSSCLMCHVTFTCVCAAANVAAVRSSGAFKVLKEIANSPVDEFKQMAATVVSNPIYK